MANSEPYPWLTDERIKEFQVCASEEEKMLMFMLMGIKKAVEEIRDILKREQVR